MKALFIANLLLGCSSALAYDSLACGPSLVPLRLDCEGTTAARTPWVHSEHAEIWLRAREMAGLPASLNDPFEVATLLGGAHVDGGDSFEAVPLDLAVDVRPRTLELAVFAQLPDKAYALWDWTSGNEGCPATGSRDLLPDCHKFTAHMGWLNSNHFLPQAEQVFRRYHGLAVERAGACGRLASALEDAGRDEPALLQACDREALILEAIAQHYLQDAWSIGHMWQRWGSPELADFSAGLAADPALGDVDAIGDAVGRGSGIVHGAKAITKLADAMCAPDDGVEFVFDGGAHAGAGDLFLERVEIDERLDDQFDFLYGCSAAAMREVYLASAQSFGPPAATQAAEANLDRCFSQRATNRAVGLGAAIQIPIALTTAAGTSVALLRLATAIARSSDAYLVSLGLSPAGRSDFYLPLTSEVLTRVNLRGILFAQSVVPRWNEDMRRIQGILSFRATLDPGGTALADGELGPLLNMEPNAAYDDRAADSSYADPPLPWTPTASDVPLSPTVNNAGNIVARTFVDAHVEDWCAVLHEDGEDEFALGHLRDRCVAARESADEDADTACAICSRFAEWLVFDPAPDVAANDALAEVPTCTIVAGAAGIRAESGAGDFDRASLARRWCSTALPTGRVEVSAGNAFVSTFALAGTVSDGESIAAPADVMDWQDASSATASDTVNGLSYAASGAASASRSLIGSLSNARVIRFIGHADGNASAPLDDGAETRADGSGQFQLSAHLLVVDSPVRFRLTVQASPLDTALDRCDGILFDETRTAFVSTLDLTTSSQVVEGELALGIAEFDVSCSVGGGASSLFPGSAEQAVDFDATLELNP